MGRKGKHPPVRGTPKVDKRSRERRKNFAALNEGQRGKSPKKKYSMYNARLVIGRDFFKKKKKTNPPSLKLWRGRRSNGKHPAKGR